MSPKHLSTHFDSDLDSVSTKMLQMGGLVEAQIAKAMLSLASRSEEQAAEVIRDEQLVNRMEVDIDGECIRIIARRQPTARDLRLVMAISKTITNLERAGDEAHKIAKRARRIINDANAEAINFSEIKQAGEMAVALLRRALDAFARLDTTAAAEIVREDKAIDEEFRAFVRKLTSYMVENPQTISASMDFLFIAKAIERIGDHAKNVAEFIIYTVKGTDVRHTPWEELAREAQN